MRKRQVFFLSFVILCGFAGAEDSGLDAGSEFYIIDATKTPVFQFAPFIEYDKRTGNFELYLKGQYYLSFESPVVESGYLEEELYYYFSFLEKNTLIFSVDQQNNFYQGASYDGLLEPALQYNRDFNFGYLMAKFGYQLYYGPKIISDNYINLGYYGNQGIGFEFTYYWYYGGNAPGDETVFEFLPNFTMKDIFYVEMEIDINHNFTAFTFQPYIEFYIRKFTIWAEVDFINAGKGRDLIIEPYVGFSYKI